MRALNFCTLVVAGLFLGLGMLTNSTFAVVTVNSGLANTQPLPSNDFGFANVGVRGSASGVYLGDRWVLTAMHVGAGDITFGGVTYHYETGSAQSIKNPTGNYRLDSTYTDLTLFRLTEEPNLPSLKIATTPPSIGTTLYLAGNGTTHQDEMTYWQVDTGSWTWTESESTTSYWGYKTDGARELSWGTNQVIGSYRGPTDSTYYLSLCDTDMVAIKTRFDNPQTNEAQAVAGDSGGGAFYWDDTENSWVFTGIISCIELLPNSPSYAVAGASTCCVDLSFYRDAILEIIGPETTPTAIPGDANGDGVVDGSDITILASNWMQVVKPGTMPEESGDFNGDGIVDGSDITILAGNWQYGIEILSGTTTSLQSLTTTGDESISGVPEPSTWVLLLCLAIGAITLKRTRK